MKTEITYPYWERIKPEVNEDRLYINIEEPVFQESEKKPESKSSSSSF